MRVVLVLNKLRLTIPAIVVGLLMLPMVAWGQEAAPPPADEGTPPAEQPAEGEVPAEPAPPPEAPSLAERLGLRSEGDEAPVMQQSISRTYGPRFHDGSNFINIELPQADIDAGLGVIEDTVRVVVDGARLMPTDFAVASRPEPGKYVVRLLRDVPANKVIEVSYQVRGGVEGPDSAFSSSLMAGPGDVQPLSLTSPEGVPGGLKLYYAKQGDILRRDIGQRRVGPNDWFQLADAVDARTQWRDSVREEYGFSVMNLQLGQAQVSYGTVSNVDATSEGSFRDQFIRQNILGTGNTAGLRPDDPAYEPPEGSSRDVTWRDWRYGTPEQSPFWYGETSFRMDPNYGHVDPKVQQDIAAFLQDPNRWGGRNLMSAWWKSGGTYAKRWQQMEGSGPKGRQHTSQFAGEELSLKTYGFQPSDNLMYSHSEFGRYLIESRRDAVQVNDSIRVGTPDGDTVFEVHEESLSVTRPPNAPDVGATEETILADPGEDTYEKHTMRSLTQRLSGGESPAQLYVQEDRFEEIDRLRGIESPTRRNTRASLSNVSLLGMQVGYTATRSEHEDMELNRWLTGATSTGSSERHSVNFSGLDIAGPLQLNGSFSAGLVDGQGLQDSTVSLQVPTFELFSGVNLAGATYTRQRDPLGASRLHRGLTLSGKTLGFDWNASASWHDMTAGFSLGRVRNPYDRDYSTHTRALNLNRTLAKFGTQLHAGYEERYVDGESQGRLYRAAFAQPIALGSLGNLTLQGSQYRHIDRLGVMRPSYGWAATWAGPEDKWTASVRGFHHYGAGDELSFVSRSLHLAAKLGDAQVSATFRDNPLWDPDGPDKPAGPRLQMGEMSEYRVDMPVNDRLSVSASFLQNAALHGGVIEGQTWNTVPFYGAMGGLPTTWGAGSENWATRYGIVYNFGEGKTVSLARSNTRYSQSGIRATGWDFNLQWALGSKDSLSFRYYNWDAQSPRFGEVVSADPGGGPLGEAYSFRYSHKWSDAQQLSVGVTKTGPLSGYYDRRRPNQNLWGQIYADFMSDVPEDTMVFVEYQTPF
jgi:hypothetical protein